MRTPITTTLSARPVISTDLNRARQFSNFLMTQALDFLMTEDENYIVLQDTSEVSTILSGRVKITTNLA